MTGTDKKLTRIFFLATFFGLLLVSSGSALTVTTGTAQWAHSTKPGVVAPGATRFNACATDSSGNTYAVGFITGGEGYDFGNNVTVTGGNTGENTKNAVIVKYNSNGLAQWAWSTDEDAPGKSEFLSVSVDSSGDIYAVGYITGAIERDLIGNPVLDGDGNPIPIPYGFGNGDTVAGGNIGYDNAVIVKYNSEDGEAQWAKSTDNTEADASYFQGVSADSSGNIYAVGYIITALDGDDVSIPYGFNGHSVTGGGDIVGTSNAIIVEYNSEDGAAQWAWSTDEDAPDSTYFNGVSADSSGNIYAVGSIRGAGPYFFNGHSVTGGGDIDSEGSPVNNAVIVRYNSDGAAQWAKSTGVDTPGTSYFHSVSLDSSGNIYAAGTITGTIETDEDGNPVLDDDGNPIPHSSYDFNASGDRGKVTGGYNGTNAVIVRYDSSGLAQWARSTDPGTLGPSSFSRVKVDSSGNVYAVGSIRGAVDNDPDPDIVEPIPITYSFGNNVTVTGGYCSVTSQNAVIVKYDTSGLARLAKSTDAGAEADSYYWGVSVDQTSGDIYAVGYINENGTFGFGDGISVAGGYDGFNAVVVKYAGEDSAIPVPQPGAAELPYTGGQPASWISNGQPIWLSLAFLAGLASVFSGFVLERKPAK